jgi:osmotically-inducible protein OsmY
VPELAFKPVVDSARKRLPGRSSGLTSSVSGAVAGVGSKVSTAAAAQVGRRAAEAGAHAVDSAAHGAARAAKSGAHAVGDGARVARSAAEFAVNVTPRPPAQRDGSAAGTAVRHTPVVAAAAAVGASVEYLLDPADGKRRRKTLRDQALARARRLVRRGAQQARYAEGKVQGAVHEAASGSSAAGTTSRTVDDDQTVADRVRSEIFRRPDAPKGSVKVTVVDGIVHLRGEVSDAEQIERLVEEARNVAGVRRVENLLHVPGVPAPTGGRA